MNTGQKKGWLEPAVHIIFWIGLMVLVLGTEQKQVIVERVGQTAQSIDLKPLLWLTYVLSAMIFYGNILVLYPRFFRKGHYLTYAVLFSIWAIGLSLLEYFYVGTLFESDAGNFYLEAGINHTVFVLFSLLYVLIKNQLELTNEQRSIKENQLVDELTFLKSQLNPHFLFNAINNIFSMAQKNNDDEVANYLSDLSKIMRYSLYESNEFKVSLEKELNFLRSYIQMSMLKFREEDLDMNFEIHGDPGHHRIAPLLLVPLVENAFKHAPVQGKQAKVFILIEVLAHQLEIRVINSYEKKTNSMEENVGGIGIKNLRRRLQLLYNDRHDLEVLDHHDKFEVKLKILFIGA